MLLAVLVVGVAAGSILAVAISARRLILQARRAGARLDFALSGGRMAAWDWDVQRGLMTLSNGAETVYGTVWKAVNEAWACVHPEDLARVRSEVDAALASSDHFRHINRIIRPDNGEVRWLETRGLVIRSPDGKPLRVTGLGIDITERQLALEAALHAEQKLQLDNQRKDEFLATLAHELRNPMAPIRYAAAVISEKASPAALQRAREMIERQSAQMSDLLDDLLDLSRITRNSIELRLKPVDLVELVGQATDSAKPMFEKYQHRLSVSMPPGSIWVSGDSTRLLQILGNLLDNAAKYMEPGGEVAVRLETDDTQAIIEITDGGMGLSEDMLPQVFDLFSQPHKSIGVQRGGLGIGLTVVKRLVELHGGAVKVTSRGLNCGATFTVSLPVIPEPVSSYSAPRRNDLVVNSIGKRPRVLIADDNPDVTESLGLLLRSENFHTSIATDGRSALAQFDAVQPAVVLLDLGLPDMDGEEVVRQIRRRPGGMAIPIIAITGWGHERARQRTADAGVTLHLVKPVDPQRLLRLVEESLEPLARTAQS